MEIKLFQWKWLGKWTWTQCGSFQFSHRDRKRYAWESKQISIESFLPIFGFYYLHYIPCCCYQCYIRVYCSSSLPSNHAFLHWCSTQSFQSFSLKVLLFDKFSRLFFSFCSLPLVSISSAFYLFSIECVLSLPFSVFLFRISGSQSCIIIAWIIICFNTWTSDVLFFRRRFFCVGVRQLYCFLHFFHLFFVSIVAINNALYGYVCVHELTVEYLIRRQNRRLPRNSTKNSPLSLYESRLKAQARSDVAEDARVTREG